MNDWKNKTVALVTGANKGIGLQIARNLATHGFTVLVGSRNLDHGETASRVWEQMPGLCRTNRKVIRWES
jgi:NAD(P)-dependent dehydrogenase (short-subunit alcohol dehydrogenase family)